MHMNTINKIVFHDNRANLALSKKIKPFVLCWKQIEFTNIFYWEIHDFILKVFLHAYLWKQINVTLIFQHNHRKVLVNTLLLVALKYVHMKRKTTLFIANTSDSVSLKLKLVVLGQNWEVNSCLRHQIFYKNHKTVFHLKP
jgi:hypothetical protein